MTVTAPERAAAPSAQTGRTPAGRGRARREPPGPAGRLDPTRSARYSAGVALGILSSVLLGLCVHLGLISHLAYSRAQQIGFNQLRLDLANSVAPVAPYYIDTPPEPDPMERVPQHAGSEQPEQSEPSEPDAAAAATNSRVLLYPGGTPIALLSIPAIGLQDVVVVEGTTGADLQSGPGHDRMSTFPGQAGTTTILGKRWSYGAPFARLTDLAAGDRIHVTTGQGQHEYVVIGLRRPGDPITPRESGSGRLVLVTAQGPAFTPEEPVYLDANLVSEVQPSSGVLAVPPELRAGPMAADSGAWFPLLLWLQGLAVVVIAFAWSWRAWGRRQTWLVGVPLLFTVGIGAAATVSRLLPNLL